MELIERLAKFRAEQLIKRDRRQGRKGSRESQLERIRRICGSTPSAFEKISHGMPTFFVEKYKNVFTMRAYLELGTPVRIQPNQSGSVSLRLIEFDRSN